ncbi:MAG: response regulator transcription factor, partial [Burkholderiaceae bacterium]|nr:response regulator transcription factor [Burkholderiaceae bacterium]
MVFRRLDLSGGHGSCVDPEQAAHVVGEVGDGEEAVSEALRLRPDVIIMDISMPKMNGLEATRLIKTSLPCIAILVLTVHNDIEHI